MAEPYMYLEDLLARRDTFISDYGKRKLYPKEVERLIKAGRVHLTRDGRPKTKPKFKPVEQPTGEDWF